MLSVLRILAATVIAVPAPSGGRPDPAQVIHQARALRQLGKIAEALGLLEEIPKQNLRGQEYDQVYLLLAEIYFASRVDYAALSKERLKCVIKACLQVIASHPQDRRSKWAYFNLALMHCARESDREAGPLFKKAVGLGADDAQNYLDALESRDGQKLEPLRDQAKVLIEKLSGLSLGQSIWHEEGSPPGISQPPAEVAPLPQTVSELLRQGNEQFKAGQYPEALETFRRLYALFPTGRISLEEKLAVLRGAKECQLKLGQTEQAASALIQTIKLEPTNLANYLELIDLYCRLDQLDYARKIIDWASRELPEGDHQALLVVITKEDAFRKLKSATPHS